MAVTPDPDSTDRQIKEIIDAKGTTSPLIDMDALRASMQERAAARNGLSEWMAKHHENLHLATLNKADEYGSLDLKLMGTILGQLMPGLAKDEATQVQAAIAYYALGKISRVFSALAESKPAPTDSWLDLEVYSMMAQRVRETGQWP